MPEANPHSSATKAPVKVVIAGGGIAAIEALLALGDSAGERVAITILTPSRAFTPPAVSTAEAFGEMPSGRLDLSRLAASCGAELRVDAVASVDPARRVVHTRLGHEHHYDALLVALGGRRRGPFAGAIAFGVPGGGASLRRMVARARVGLAREIAFVLTPANTWTLPLYELALLTAGEAALGAHVHLVTSEDRPLAVFGDDASGLLERTLADAGIVLHTGVLADPQGDLLVTVPKGERIAVDSLVTLAVTDGPAVAGLPSDSAGFLPTDAHGRVLGVERVWAAGDAAAWPVKQGGLACQQADAAAESIAAFAGAAIEPTPFDPVLRGILRTWTHPLHLRRRHGLTAASAGHALWWPPAKVAGRWLGPLLAAEPSMPPPGALSVSAPLSRAAAADELEFLAGRT